MGEGEIVIRFKVPSDWDADTLSLVRRKIVVEVTRELQKRIEEARRFQEIIGKVKIENEEEAKELEEEVKRSLAERYKGV